MTTTIALAGKGGTGKTTVAALLIKYLVEQASGTILAIDADPSTNLNLALGLPLSETIGDIREEMLADVSATGTLTTKSGMSKLDYLDYQIEYALVEGQHVDLLAMGRPEGPGCYCPVNLMLREIIDRMGKSYDYVVIDNEAGLEHLSRRTTRDVEMLIIVTDPSMRGVIAAERIVQISHELDIHIAQSCLVVNRVIDGLTPTLQAKIDGLNIPLHYTIPNDTAVMALDAQGRPLVELADDSVIFRSIREIAQSILPVAAGALNGKQ